MKLSVVEVSLIEVVPPRDVYDLLTGGTKFDAVILVATQAWFLSRRTFEHRVGRWSVSQSKRHAVLQTPAPVASTPSGGHTKACTPGAERGTTLRLWGCRSLSITERRCWQRHGETMTRAHSDTCTSGGAEV